MKKGETLADLAFLTPKGSCVDDLEPCTRRHFARFANRFGRRLVDWHRVLACSFGLHPRVLHRFRRGVDADLA